MRDQYNPTDYSIGVIPYCMGSKPMQRNKDKTLFYCQTQSDIKYLLIHHTKGHWAFPKGHAETGETMQQTALRELREETGVTQVTLGDTIYTEHYEFDHKGVHVSKQVDYYLGYCDQCRSTTIQPEETIEAGWYSYNEAINLITFIETKNLLQTIHHTMT